MPGKPHLTLTLWQCFPDVGGCDAWLSTWWEAPNDTHSWQCYVGWHSPDGLENWSWPNGEWHLIGHKRWETINGFTFKSAAQYANPNPSTTARGRDLTPNGHWSYLYSVDGEIQMSTWSNDILDEDVSALYQQKFAEHKVQLKSARTSIEKRFQGEEMIKDMPWHLRVPLGHVLSEEPVILLRGPL